MQAELLEVAIAEGKKTLTGIQWISTLRVGEAVSRQPSACLLLREAWPKN